ncbi:LacI family DNA-binding transcriptional regulator [Actinosynnema pretiosum subsp. pretiosum]|uniref:LacI family DNA-binding transcriptional regulator n=1 Tax=Actinosynnema pretiosum subsp. pretiosum TaxID=103721 RepID=A0AA45LC94_9PSEU|nr:Transcriptional regulator, LacI family [Actinosynnema pretiosum subsp. pretiosum]QUF07221.1 LacI family DNA-binding transcriptional regulator [Actinosynnema pretiosum subsp. pretiosum]
MDTARPRRPTLDTVAGAVGVSRATVSNAYNRPDQLSAALRERILVEAARLGYAGPDPVARSLATRHSAAVGFLLGQRLTAAFSDPALSIVLDGLATTVDGHDHSLVLMAGSAGPRAETVARAQADVVVAYSLPEDAPGLAAARARGLPLVVVDQPEAPGVAWVGVDDEGGARLAAEHVRALGHERVAVLTFALHPDGVTGLADRARLRSTAPGVAGRRARGYLEVLGEAPVWECEVSDRALGRAGARELLRLPGRPTAILCASDELAFGALAAARDLGLRVPEDVSVVGFDDIPAAEQAEPPLTTVRQPLTEKGRRAGELALGLLDGERPGRPLRLPVSLIERASTTRLT